MIPPVEAPRDCSIEVMFAKCHHDAKMPTYGSDGAMCFDFYAVERFALPVGHSRVTGTGIKIAIPKGYGMLAVGRSGHGFNFNTRLANCVGIIDSDYRGEIMVKLTRDDPTGGYPQNLTIYPGDRILQAVILPYQKVTFIEVDTLDDTHRGAGGFGSTGA